jgi:NADPH-dependent 2,4-dienoyl-CoA reductase/sulfur reductase-like enzyme
LDIVIVGNGVAGITCAFTARQRDPDASITVVSGETDYFFSRTALMYAYMDRMNRRDLEPYERGAYDRQRIERVRDWVVDLDADARTIRLEGGRTLSYDRLVFAVGARPNMFPWAGADAVQDGLVHFVSMQDLDDCERLTPSTREAVVVGGGLIGIELVECLAFHGIKVTFMVREPHYWPVALGAEEADFVAGHMSRHGVEVRLSEEMERIEVDGQGRVAGIVTNKGETIPCQMLGIAAGVSPNIARLKGFKDAPPVGRGIVVDETLETQIPGVFACGDCAEIHTADGRTISELIWYSARRQGRVAGHNLFGDGRRYEPPTFFNSSKFFEIEYTTVGEVMRAPAGTRSIYLKMPGRDISARVVHDGERVLGFNMLGSRWNHEVLQRWVDERRSPEFVAAHLEQAQYDVEFGRLRISALQRQDMALDARHGAEAGR